MTENNTHTNPVDSLTLNASEAWVENFIPELHNCNVIHMSPSIGNPEYCTIEQIIDYIDRRYKPSEVNHIVFNSESEGFFRLLIDRVNELLEIILPRYNLTPADISYFSGAVPTSLNTQVFRELIQHPINLYYVSSWPDCGVSGKGHVEQWLEAEQEGIEKTRVLLCYNNGPKPHRVATVAQLLQRGLSGCSYISATFNIDEVKTDELSLAFPHIGPGCADTITQIQDQLPMELTISRQDFRNNQASHFEIGIQDYLHHRNSYFSVITESQYFNKENNARFYAPEPSYSCAFATEKTYRTIFLKHPFVMISTPGFLAALREAGYRTFHPFINEDYDTIQDDEQRLIAALDEVSRLVAFNRDDWDKWLTNIKPIVEYNFQHLKNNRHYAIKA